ncbi:hypothetical protein BOTCAL_0098g00020 [Botryotinia calthae]|uniref:Uncharacterized protein n=1 Tax=Botryotinia calthae TaxID=38488 RepID=A0A4Y8D8R7_9HELO|nr:hypothetical protein BOTCAL_0098g00020 [Botryotinia calthae]
MNPQPDDLASQEPQTASNNSESESDNAFTQTSVLSTLDRKVLDEDLRTQWKIFSEDDKTFGSLDIKGGYVAHDMGTWRQNVSSCSPKDILSLKRTLAAKVFHFWEKNPDPAWIPGAKEEQAFTEAYENMVKTMQGIPAEQADKYSAYMEHRLRLATSTDDGKTLGPLLHEVLSNKVINPEMRTAAFQVAKALHPERYVKLDDNDGMEVDHSQNENWKNSSKVAVRSLDGRSLPLLIKQSLGKRKTFSGDKDDEDMNMEGKRNNGSLNTVTAGSSGFHAKPLQDWNSRLQSILKQDIETRAIRAAKHLAKKSQPFQKRKKLYSWMKPERDEHETETSGLRTSRLRTFDTGKSYTRYPRICTLHNFPEFELSDFTAPLTLLSQPNKRRKMTEAEVEEKDGKFTLDISGPDWVRKW